MKKFETRTWVEFSNSGEKILGVLHQPLGVESAPAVLFFHGLAGSKVGEHRMYVLLAECLSQSGIASLRFDFRGSGDSEGSFPEMSLQGEVGDAVKAVEFLQQQPNIDNARIGFFGRSFGGPLAIMAAHRLGIVKTIALWAPVFNGEQWEEHWEKSQAGKLSKEERHNLMRINGQLPSLEFYEELFQMNIQGELLALGKVPLLLIHGEKDPKVGIRHSEKYADVRGKAEAQTKFIRLSHSDHDFSHPEEKLNAIKLTCEWFSQTL